MAKNPLEIKGLNEILKSLEALGDKAADAQREVLTEAGEHLLKETKAAAPTDPEETEMNSVYGTLEENIELEWDGISDTLYLTSGDAFWSVFLEYGYPGYPAQPFMYPTFKKNRTKMKNMIKKETQKRLDL